LNVYLSDGIRNLRRASHIINCMMSEEEVEDATLFFAFGMERMCKGLLFEINPSFILDVAKFADVVNALYLDRVTDKNAPELKSSKQVAFSSFRDLINKCSIFYADVKGNKDILNNLREYRNILVHGSFQNFEHQKTHKWLIGVYFPVVYEILKVCEIEKESVFGAKSDLLEKLALNAKHEEEIQKRVSAMLEASRVKWDCQRNEKHVRTSAINTAADVGQPRSVHDNAFYRYPCPSCANTAVLEVEPDFDYSDGCGYISGVYPTEVRCHYCGLMVSDYEDVSYLIGNDWWEKTLDNKTQS